MRLNTSKWMIGVTLLLMASPACFATKDRGVWFWASSSSTYGSYNVVGSPTEENDTLAFFNHWGIKRVYGSYQARPITEPSVIAAWNTKLNAAGIESQFLMSENTWIYPTNRTSFLRKISDRLIDFNSGRISAEQFDGLHLDIEPQALEEWSTGTDSEKRDLLNLLRDTYADVRAHFVTNGLADFPIYADLPVWFDNLESIGWTNAAERDAWFAAISTNLTGVSLMPFDRTSFSSIDNGVTWERVNMTNAYVRTGLESDIGASDTWSTSFDFHAMLETLEINYGTDNACDIQAYAIWRQALSDEGFGTVDLTLQTKGEAKQGNLLFNTQVGTTYAVLHSLNLCNWQEIGRFSGMVNMSTNFPISITNDVGFYQAQKLIPLP